MRRSTGQYPPNWKAIAKRVKDEAGWRCIRCDHPHDRESGHILTVHHLDMNPENNAWQNLLPLCQRCHLTIQHKVILERQWMFDHSDWFKPYAAGYYASQAGLPTDREWVTAHMDELLELGKPITEARNEG